MGCFSGCTTGTPSQADVDRPEPQEVLVSKEAVQMPASTTSKRGLGREEWAALLRVRIRPESPEGNQSELTWASKPDCGIATMQKART